MVTQSGIGSGVGAIGHELAHAGVKPVELPASVHALEIVSTPTWVPGRT